ncbi:MAG: hypothetical protein R3D30_11735 [Hyphomicrobiales bacterium]
MMLTGTLSRFCLLTALLAISLTAAHAEPCRKAADDVVQIATTELLQKVLEDDPALAEMDENALVLQAGKRLMESPRPDLKARGWMMLLWYGDKTEHDLVAKSAETLQTEEDRAHLYFVMGLYQLTASTADTAAGGRDLLAKVKDTGKVTFVPDEMWTMFLETCELPG